MTTIAGAALASTTRAGLGVRLRDHAVRATISLTARRQLTDKLPESVAFAAYEFIVGPLLDNPHRVGRRLRPPLGYRYSARRGTYRVIYRIDGEHRRVTVVGVFHLADAYRSA